MLLSKWFTIWDIFPIKDRKGKQLHLKLAHIDLQRSFTFGLTNALSWFLCLCPADQQQWRQRCSSGAVVRLFRRRPSGPVDRQWRYLTSVGRERPRQIRPVLGVCCHCMHRLEYSVESFKLLVFASVPKCLVIFPSIRKSFPYEEPSRVTSSIIKPHDQNSKFCP